MQDLRRKAGNDRHRDDQTQADGATDGDGDVTEELSGFLLHEENRHENRDGGQGACQDSSPDLARAFVGGLRARLAHLAVPVDVFQHDDGIVHHHADRKGHPCQADDVQRALEPHHHQKGPDDADGDGYSHNQGAGGAAQEKQ